MTDIGLYISKLLFENNKVVIPEFGFFETQIVESYHHPVSHEFTPKHKKITFTKDDTITDSVLLNNINSSDIKAFVKLIKESLETKKEYNFKNLGTIKLHSTGTLYFEQDLNFNYDKSFFGFEAFVQEPIKAKETIAPIVATHSVDEDSNKKMVWIWWLLGVTAAASLVVAVVMNWDSIIKSPDTPLVKQTEEKAPLVEETNTIAVDTLSENDKTSVPQEDTMEVIANNTSDIENDIEDVDNAAESNVVEESKVSVDDNAAIEVATVNSDKKYFVIAGCFRSEKKAQDYLGGIIDKGYSDASIEGKTPKGLIRVCYAGFETSSQAKVFLKEVSEKEEKNLWIQKITD